MAPFTKKEGEEAYGKAALYGKPFTGRDGPYEKAGPYEQGRSLRKGPGCRTAHGKLRGGTLPELGGNFRLCAVDQKRPFFPRVGPFLALLPFKGPYGKPLTGEGTVLTRRVPYGTVPYEKGRSLTGRAGVPYGSFTEKDDEEAYGKAGLLWEAPYRRNGPYGKGRSLREGPREGRAYGKPLTRRNGPYGKGRSLRGWVPS